MNYTYLKFDVIESTSDLLKEHFSSFSAFTWVRANYQSKGRGQFDRMWVSNPGENLLLSVLLKDIALKDMEKISIWMIEGLKNTLLNYHIKTRFKAPNDLYVGDDKICGILTETSIIDGQYNYIVIGMGLNVNQVNFEGLPATSMFNLSNFKFDIDKLTEVLMGHLMETYPL